MFWADCGTGVGLGHIGRSAAVAAAWIAAGHEAVLMLPERGGEELMAGESLPPARVGDFAEFAAQAARSGARVAVLDSYRLPPDAATRVRRPGVAVAAFDDDGGDVLGADVVINGAPGAESRGLPRRPDARYLLGARFF